jgi:hypothetical protein
VSFLVGNLPKFGSGKLAAQLAEPLLAAVPRAPGIEQDANALPDQNAQAQRCAAYSDSNSSVGIQM